MQAGHVATGHPVDVASGAVFTVGHDFCLPGTVELLWNRRYSTDSAANGWLGRGWTVPYFMTLEQVPGGYRLLDEGGGFLVFQIPTQVLGVGERVVNFGANMELRREQNYFSILHWHWGGDSVERFVFQPGDARLMRLAWIENLAGHRIHLQYDSRQRPWKIKQELEERVVELTYNEQSLVQSVHLLRDNGGRKTLINYEFDGDGHLIAAVDPLGNRASYEYDLDHQMIRETNALGSTFSFRYDREGRCVFSSGDNGYLARRLQYFAVPHMTRVTNSLGHKTEYYLNPANQVVQEISPLGIPTTKQYDEHGRPTAVTNGVGAVTQYRYDERGNRAAIVHADGGESLLKYNELHVLTEYTNPMGATWKYEHDKKGNILALTDPLGHRLSCVRDGQGLVVSSRTPGGLVISRQYGPRLRWVEASDQISLLTRLEYDEAGNQTAIDDALGPLQRVRFDEMNNPVEIVEADGQTYRLSWNVLGDLVERTGPDIGWERRQYDRFGQLIEHSNPLGAMRLEYNTEGMLTAVVNRAGERLERTYDAEGRLTAERSFDGRIERFEYDLRGFPVKIVKADGRTVALTYDKAGAVVGRESSDGLQEELAYDKNGDLVLARNKDSSVELERNALGMVVAEIQNGRRIEYEYDDEGTRTVRRMVGVEGGLIARQNDLRGRPVTLTDSAGVCQELRWDSVNRLVQRRIPAGVIEDLAYNREGRIEQQRVFSLQEGTVVARRYEYNAMGNFTVWEDVRRGRATFQYDEIGRLTEVRKRDRVMEHYRYDPNGTILETHRGRRVVSAGGRTLDDGARSLIYGDDGCVAETHSKGMDLKLTYDVDGALVKVKRSDGTEITYTYDALGRRTAKQVGKERTEFLWEGCVLAAEGKDGTFSEKYYFFGLDPLAQWSRSRRLIPVTNQAGAVLEVLSEGGNLLWDGTLDAYGNLVSDNGSPGSVFRLRGQYYDRETGFHYNFRRSYDPLLCDYLSPDPIGIRGGANFYSYPRNPLLWDDPFGLKCGTAACGEKSMDGFFGQMGYKKISVRGKNPNANGIDAIYHNPNLNPPYIIAEAKNRGGYLHTRNGVQQMSDHWINTPAGNHPENRLREALPPPKPGEPDHYANIRNASSGDVGKRTYYPEREPKIQDSGDYGGKYSNSKTF
jgi:RHS repeat-associated protein